MLCKAVKADQWQLVKWMLESGSGGCSEGMAVQLAQQLDLEFAGLWDGMERSAVVRDHAELESLCSCLDDKGKLRRAWRRGAKTVLAGSTLLSPRQDVLR